MLNIIVGFSNYVDWSGRHETPVGVAGQGRPSTGALRREGYPTARGAKWKKLFPSIGMSKGCKTTDY